MTVQTAGNLTGIAGVIAKYADNDADPYDRATQLAALAQYLNLHTHQSGMGAPVANLAANVNHSVNGLLNIWQRTVQAYTVTGGTAGPDGESIVLAGTDTVSCTQDTANRDVANGATYSLACAFTLGTGAGGSVIQADRPAFKLTTDNYGFMRGHTITRTRRIKSSVPNAVRLGMITNGTGGTTTYSAYHPGDGTWQTLSVTATIPTDATYVFPEVYFAASGTHYLGAHSTVIGSNAVDPYAVALSPADDLARCMRYYQRWSGNNGYIAEGTAQNTTTQFMLLTHARFGGVPSLTFSALGDWLVVSETLTTSAAPNALSINNAQVSQTLLLATTAAGLGTAGSPKFLAAGNANAWLALEWNP